MALLAKGLPVLGGLLFAIVYVIPVVERWGLPSLAGELVGLVIVSFLALPFIVLPARRQSDDYTFARYPRPAVSASLCVASVVVAGLLADASGAAEPVGGVLPWTVAVAAVAWAGTLRYTRKSEARLLDRVLRVKHPPHALELVERCRTALRDDRLTLDERTAISLSLSAALITLSARADQDDNLREAFDILDETLRSGSPAFAFQAAWQLVDAMRVKYARTTDEAGYDLALETLEAAAERAGTAVPEARGKVFAARAMRRAQQAYGVTGSAKAELDALVVADLERAVASTPDHLDEHALHTAALARARAFSSLPHDIDAEVRRCRSAVRRLARSGSDNGIDARLALADLLELRSRVAPSGGVGAMMERWWPGGPTHRVARRLWPDRATNDLVRAGVICAMLSVTGGREASEARARLVRIRDRLLETWAGAGSLPQFSVRHTGLMYRLAVAEQSGTSHDTAARLAESWAAWAAARGDEAQAAEAGWRQVTAIAADIRRRVLHGKQQRISAVGGRFVEVADRLARVGRLSDAAVALDLGRAVVLTERMQRRREGLDARLIAADRADLADRWLLAEAQIEHTDRAAATPGDPTAGERGSSEYRALAEHEALLREISRLPGFEDVDAAPDYADLRAAAADGPIVYLVPLANRGFGLIVRADQEPACVALPQLRSGRVLEHLCDLRAAAELQDLVDLLTSLLPALWSTVLGPVVSELPAGSLVTLIPVGVLGELPVHMAGTAPGDDGIWLDQTGGMAFRYAPNARVLLRAQRTARALTGTELGVLSAGVPTAKDAPPLPHALEEARHVASAFPPALARQPEPATRQSVLDHLADYAIWHFACHGEHDPLSPLDSRLKLADGPLTLGAIFARPQADRRLSVLSACQTSKLDASLPDEVIGFPSAMLQSGVAGVVACQAAVEDPAAMLLVLDFFARFRASGSPARALADAQAWLRTATNPEIRAAYPDLHPPPDEDWDDLDEWQRQRPFAHPCTWVLFNYTGA